jgi:hypothetical protein
MDSIIALLDEDIEYEDEDALDEAIEVGGELLFRDLSFKQN